MFNIRETLRELGYVVKAIAEKTQQFSKAEVEQIEIEAVEMVAGLPGLSLKDAKEFCITSRRNDKLLAQRKDNQ